MKLSVDAEPREAHGLTITRVNIVMDVIGLPPLTNIYDEARNLMTNLSTIESEKDRDDE